MIINSIEIEGYKSIKKTILELKSINLLIGSNGSGKSNFISFFEFLNQLYEQKLEAYISLRGGQEKMLFQGLKVSSNIKSHLSFNAGLNGYSFTLTAGENNMIFTKEHLWYNNDSWSMTSYTPKAGVKFNKKGRGKYVNDFLKNFRKYHFHDTGKKSPFSSTSHIDNDAFFLYEEGSNLASFLNNILHNDKIIYSRIIQTIQSVAPYFSDFFFQPNQQGNLRLQWQSKHSSTIYGANDLSDGTLRFIALTTLFLQPNIPNTIIIDEPELGLHPFAIAKLAGMIKSVTLKNAQVIIATQSADLINHFNAEDIITVDQVNGESIFTRLNETHLESWLEDYNIGDLWQKNIIKGGQTTK